MIMLLLEYSKKPFLCIRKLEARLFLKLLLGVKSLKTLINTDERLFSPLYHKISQV